MCVTRPTVTPVPPYNESMIERKKRRIAQQTSRVNAKCPRCNTSDSVHKIHHYTEDYEDKDFSDLTEFLHCRSCNHIFSYKTQVKRETVTTYVRGGMGNAQLISWDSGSYSSNGKVLGKPRTVIRVGKWTTTKKRRKLNEL